MTELLEATPQAATPVHVDVPPDEPLVYYIRRDGLIKIGYTTRFFGRMHDLRPDEVLAVEPGSLSLEADRHSQFAAHRLLNYPAGREWFEPAPELIDHIAHTAAIYAVPEQPLRKERGLGPAPDPLTQEELEAAYIVLKYEGADYKTLDEETLYSIARSILLGPRILQACIHELVNRGETFASLATQLDVHQATVARWAKSPKKHPRRSPAAT